MKSLLAVLLFIAIVYIIYQKNTITDLEAGQQAKLSNLIAQSKTDLDRAIQKISDKEKDMDKLSKELNDLKSKSIQDTTYIILKRVYTPGKLTQIKAPVQYPNTETLNVENERTAPKWELYVQGAQSGREYPPISVTQTAYAQFIEGAICARVDLLGAKTQ